MTESEIVSLLPAFLRNSLTYSLVATDLEGKYTFVNDIFKERFAFLGDDFIGKPVEFAIHPEDLQECGEIAQKCIQSPDQVFPLQIRKPSNNEGEFHWTHWEFSLLRDADNIPCGILCVGHDITRVQNMDAQLLISENKIIEQGEKLRLITWQQSHAVRRHIVNIMGLYNIIKIDQKISAEEKLQHLDSLLLEVKELDLTIRFIVSSSVG